MKKILHLLSKSVALTMKTVLLPAILIFVAREGLSQARLIKDINTYEDVYGNEYSDLIAGSDKVYFIGKHNELWKTTGNAGGTVRIRPFKSINNLTPMGSTLFFTADDGSGPGLWRTTGTFASTVKVKGFSAGPPSWLTVIDNVIYFSAHTANGSELWKSDGTPEGTVEVYDIQKGKRSSDPTWLTNVGGTLYFVANDGKSGHEIWTSDGTAAGTKLVKDIRPGSYLGSAPDKLTNVNGTLFFVALNDGTGRELYKSDGTAEGTVLLRDIRPGGGYGGVENLTAVSNALFFTADDGVHGHELWKSDGTESGTVLVKDMTPGREGSNGTEVFTHPMANFKEVFGLLYYTAYASGTYYVWKSDGTEAGTVPLFIASHAIGQPTCRFVPMGKFIYYFDMSEDEDSYYEFHLYRMNRDGTNPTIITTLVIEDYYSTYEPELVMLWNSLYFWGRDDPSQGFKLFRSNGTPGNRSVIKDIQKIGISSNPEKFTKLGNKVLFIAEDQLFDPALWITDGSGNGTTKVHDIDYAHDLVSTSTHVFYSLNYGLEIWKTDGTERGTVMVKKNASVSTAHNLVAVNDVVFIQTSGDGLWRTDGTDAGTIQIAEGTIHWMQKVDDLLVFAVNKGNYVIELWRTNGMPEGTSRIWTFSGRKQSYHNGRAVSGNVVYFVADDGATGNELWRTDGTTSGTCRVIDMNAKDDRLTAGKEDDIRALAVHNGTLYFSAYDDTNSWALYRSDGAGGNATKIRNVDPVLDMVPTEYGLHLFTQDYNGGVRHWVTDGSSIGTKVINDETLGLPLQTVVSNDILYYSEGNEVLWRSDGSACGTYALDLGLEGLLSITALENLLIINGLTAEVGYELYAYDLSMAPQSPCGEPSVKMASHSPAQNTVARLTLYPNPFTDEVLINITGSDNDLVNISTFSQSGFPLETFSQLKTNTNHRIGKSWKPGHYIIRVIVSGQVTSHQVLKE